MMVVPGVLIDLQAPPHQIAALHEIHQLIVEHDLPEAELEVLRLFGITVTRADQTRLSPLARQQPVRQR